LYSNHLDQAREQLSCEPRPLPVMKINPEVKDIDGFKFEGSVLEGYDPWPAIKAPIRGVSRGSSGYLQRPDGGALRVIAMRSGSHETGSEQTTAFPVATTVANPWPV